MRTVAIWNQKGGSGKTATTVNLAACFAAEGLSVLVIDLDSQGNATSWLGLDDGSRALLDVLSGQGQLVDAVRPTPVAGVACVPGSAWLSNLEQATAGDYGRELVLREALETVPPRWDVVLIDCPPALGLATVMALAAVSRVWVPVEASSLGLSGVAGMLATVGRVAQRLNQDLRIGAVLACRVDRTLVARDVSESLARHFPEQLLETRIREDVRLREAPDHRQPITDYAPESRAAQDYRAAARELIQRKEVPHGGTQRPGVGPPRRPDPVRPRPGAAGPG